MGDRIGTDLPNLESFMKELYKKCQTQNLTPDQFAEICKHLTGLEEIVDITLRDLPRYHEGLVHDTKTLRSELEGLEQDIKQEKEELSQILDTKKVTMQQLDHYMITKDELAKYGIRMDEPILLCSALRNSKECNYDPAKIGKAISEIECFRQEKDDLKRSINSMRKEEETTKRNLESLKKELEKHKVMLGTYEKLSAMQFGLNALKVLHTTVTEISSGNSIRQEEVSQRFMKHVEDDYNSVLGFGKRIEEYKQQMKEYETRERLLRD